MWRLFLFFFVLDPAAHRNNRHKRTVINRQRIYIQILMYTQKFKSYPPIPVDNVCFLVDNYDLSAK